MRFTEFFCGIGLVRMGLESSHWSCVFANDIDPNKARVYRKNFGTEVVTCDIATLSADAIPDAELATASFPCQDVSLAGKRRGLGAARSGTFWEFWRILTELRAQARLPKGVLLENVVGLLSSHGGQDIRELLLALNGLGYGCDVLVVDAVHFLPQSRPRVFIVGRLATQQGEVPPSVAPPPHLFRPKNVLQLVAANPDIVWHPLALPAPPPASTLRLADLVEPQSNAWFDG